MREVPGTATGRAGDAPARVAVLLAAYNGMAHLPEQLASILGQRNVAVHVFVSVDLSSDGTEAWLDEQAHADGRVVPLAHGQRFGGAAPNFFRLLSDVPFDAFDLVAFADQDDIWHADKLQRAAAAMRVRDLAGYSSDVTAFWPDGRERLLRKARPQRRWDYLFESAGPGCTYVMTTALARALRDRLSTDDDARARIVYHDWFAYAFARSRGLAWFIDPVPGMRYRQHAANQLGANAGLRSAWQRMRLVFNGWAFAQAIFIARLAGMDFRDAPLCDLVGGPAGFLRLALRAPQCRRAPRDQLAFLLGCLWLALRPARMPIAEREGAGTP